MFIWLVEHVRGYNIQIDFLSSFQARADFQIQFPDGPPAKPAEDLANDDDHRDDDDDLFGDEDLDDVEDVASVEDLADEYFGTDDYLLK